LHIYALFSLSFEEIVQLIGSICCRAASVEAKSISFSCQHFFGRPTEQEACLLDLTWKLPLALWHASLGLRIAAAAKTRATTTPFPQRTQFARYSSVVFHPLFWCTFFIRRHPQVLYLYRIYLTPLDARSFKLILELFCPSKEICHLFSIFKRSFSKKA
jgi:hypothetical protein